MAPHCTLNYICRMCLADNVDKSEFDPTFNSIFQLVILLPSSFVASTNKCTQARDSLARDNAAGVHCKYYRIYTQQKHYFIIMKSILITSFFFVSLLLSNIFFCYLFSLYSHHHHSVPVILFVSL